MQKFRFLMSRRERSRADARLGDVLSLRQSLRTMSPGKRAELLEDKQGGLRVLRRDAIADTLGLACLAALCIGVAFPSLVGLSLAFAVRLGSLALLAFPVYRLVGVMDASQRAYHSVSAEIRAIVEFGLPQPSRFDEE